MKQVWHYTLWFSAADIYGISPLWKITQGDPNFSIFKLEFELITVYGTVRFKTDQFSGIEMMQVGNKQREAFNAYTKEYNEFKDWLSLKKAEKK